MSHVLEILPPEIGLPEKFADWRNGQDEAIVRIIDSTKRFICIAAPTGFGKSLAYTASALLNADRAVILTMTKNLQTQNMTDFRGVGMVDVRGRANYSCVLGCDCEEGAQVRCSSGHSRLCPYWDAYQTALSSELVVTNYAYWMLVNKYSDGLGKVGLLVCDEAHEAAEAVCSTVSVHLSSEDVLGRLRANWPRHDSSIDAWKQWAVRVLPRAQEYQSQLEQMAEESNWQLTRTQGRELVRAKNLTRDLDTLVSAIGPWESEPTRRGYLLEPLWASQYSEAVLFQGAPKILLISATIMEQTAADLGVEEEDLEFIEFESTFPASRSPVYFIPTAQVSKDMSASGEADLVNRIDEIIRSRKDRRGLIHCVSYPLRDRLMGVSEFSDRMVTHDSGSASANEAIRRFRSMPPPAILISPAMTTGYDFPYTDVEYMIVAKLPFPDSRSRIVKARMGMNYPPRSKERKRGEVYSMSQVALTLVQSAGRGMRAADDRCEIFIIDNNIRWFWGRWKKLLPLWFRRLYKIRDTVPAPPRTLEQEVSLGLIKDFRSSAKAT